MRTLVFPSPVYTISIHGYILPHFPISLEARLYTQMRVTSKHLSFLCICSFRISTVGIALRWDNDAFFLETFNGQNNSLCGASRCPLERQEKPVILDEWLITWLMTLPPPSCQGHSKRPSNRSTFQRACDGNIFYLSRF